MKGHLLVQTDDVESTTNFTQQVRLELLSDLCPNGKLPTDVESARLTMSLLNKKQLIAAKKQINNLKIFFFIFYLLKQFFLFIQSINTKQTNYNYNW